MLPHYLINHQTENIACTVVYIIWIQYSLVIAKHTQSLPILGVRKLHQFNLHIILLEQWTLL